MSTAPTRTAADGAVSKVWFSIADGVLTETMYGLIHEAQIKQMRFAVQTATGLAVEGADTIVQDRISARRRRRPPAVAGLQDHHHRQAGPLRDREADLHRSRPQRLFVRVTVKALKGPVTPDPGAGAAHGQHRRRRHGRGVEDGADGLRGKAFLSLKGPSPSPRPRAACAQGQRRPAGPEGRRPTLGQGRDRPDRSTAGRGQREATFDFAIGFGPTPRPPTPTAAATLKHRLCRGAGPLQRQGARVGWEDYLASLTSCRACARRRTDGGKLVQASALMLKVQEDRTYAGALIASLSNPWGDTVDASKPSTGYKAVWPRDFYQCAMALAALGDRQTPLAAFHYLPTVQVGPNTKGNKGDGGWFLQKSAGRRHARMGRRPAGPDRHADHAGLEAVEAGLALGGRAEGLLRQDDQAGRRLPGRGAARSTWAGTTRPSPRRSPSRSAGKSRAATRPRPPPP
jgi:glucoamylase